MTLEPLICGTEGGEFYDRGEFIEIYDSLCTSSLFLEEDKVLALIDWLIAYQNREKE